MLKKIIRWAFVLVLAIFLGFHAMVAVLLGAGKFMPVTESAFMMAHRVGGGSVQQTWVDYDNIAKSVKQAAIVSEDARFSQHHGFDFESIERAIKTNEARGAISIGGSTISQQLAKNLFLTSHRSYIRKAEEAIIVVMMEGIWDKRRILEVYLNVVEFGDGIYGIEAAARHYYGKSAKQLSREQAALLISMLPNPKYFQKNNNAKRLRSKQRIILARMNSAILPN
ncbi:monofunctional biosynthetic peptidoglycan transglycosylase [Moraxella haemolytica]|uniref:monofunctional biosynthetic peptidoglycan transglycosylase n=1 Tax=Moraxella TaxID=475 RepID=UPI002543AA25|nr:monofunctional biosynthetic peptidoglycan transglycosylase [Moraxella sp. ZY171148]WII94603.1 monofunctional biosynthetic peptidoglycan transglycosylase [Moraxella sp. ZY171148]